MTHQELRLDIPTLQKILQAPRSLPQIRHLLRVPLEQYEELSGQILKLVEAGHIKQRALEDRGCQVPMFYWHDSRYCL